MDNQVGVDNLDQEEEEEDEVDNQHWMVEEDTWVVAVALDVVQADDNALVDSLVMVFQDD